MADRGFTPGAISATSAARLHGPADLDKIAQKLADTLDPDGSLEGKDPADRA